ncbi:NAD-dependent epimerase/dehydratase family protein [Mucilaginibacter sp. E4BP6]|uniref:NAD-dependent epimerase/dehydratase family protein n=1 Tax=Mucilaginibacter sp. E4BP6 TaxID=2723089 RepID=UPI0015C79399|nr:NAD-dependent epimerase/dehydratase family protein [Mucilaginibacter sp. E4BP6]NYE67920.1 nucleoside-diphosphate-sugar epimerase [Mucilaginibacter sp. E4BP6]
MGDIKNILLTGATGYLGSKLAQSFLDNGYGLFVLKREHSPLSKILPIIDKVRLYNVETVNYDELFKENKIDAIVHTATLYGRNNESIVELYHANLIFPLRLLDSGIKYGVKYFFNANTTLPPSLNPYALSKMQFSDILKLKSKDIKVIDVELQYFYGPKDDPSKFVSFLISKFKTNAPVIDLSAGMQVRDFIYIDDVISGYITLLKYAERFTDFKSVPLGSGQGILLKDLVNKIKLNFDGNNSILNFGAIPTRDGEVMHSVADITFLNELGWTPSFDINEGLRKTITIENSILYD